MLEPGARVRGYVGDGRYYDYRCSTRPLECELVGKQYDCTCNY